MTTPEGMPPTGTAVHGPRTTNTGALATLVTVFFFGDLLRPGMASSFLFVRITLSWISSRASW